MAITFNIPATIIVGGGASNEVGAQAKKFGVKNVLLVTDSFMENCGLAGKVADSMRRADLNVTVFTGVQPDPIDLNVLARHVGSQETEGQGPIQQLQI